MSGMGPAAGGGGSSSSSSPCGSSSLLCQLPDEILLAVLRHVDGQGAPSLSATASKLRMAGVCRRFRALLQVSILAHGAADLGFCCVVSA